MVILGRWYFDSPGDTSMTIRHFGLSIAALAAVSPALCNAGTAKASLDACVTAFEKTLAPADEARHAFKVVYDSEQVSSSIADFYPTSYTFDLQANNSKTGAVVARVRCLADRRGGVALTSLLDAPQSPARVAQR
jgi:hypothetical protein